MVEGIEWEKTVALRVAIAAFRSSTFPTALVKPMTSADGRFVTSFNGKIYKELRDRLEVRGHVFRTTSDTEVLLHLYADKGEAMSNDLRGMFAFAIWDAKKYSLLLVRDSYGIKPLYYADDGRTLCAALQVKALMAGKGLQFSPDPAGWGGIFWGAAPEPFTFLLPDSCLAGWQLAAGR